MGYTLEQFLEEKMMKKAVALILALAMVMMFTVAFAETDAAAAESGDTSAVASPTTE